MNLASHDLLLQRVHLFSMWPDGLGGMTEDEMVGWHHRLNGHEFEQAPGDGEGQGSLVCCSLWGLRVGRDWRLSDFLPNECQLEQQSLVREWTQCDAAEPWEQIV